MIWRFFRRKNKIPGSSESGVSDKTLRKKNKKRRLLKIFLSILSFLIIIYIALTALITSNAFSRWVVEKTQILLPELVVTELKGNFFNGLQLNGRYQLESVIVDVEKLNIAVQPSCLWKLSVCINELVADTVSIELIASRKPPEDVKQVIVLPRISSPIAASIDRLRVNKLIIANRVAAEQMLASNSDETTSKHIIYEATNIRSRLDINNAVVTIEKLTLSDRYCDWSLKTKATLDKNYPLKSSVKCEISTGDNSALDKAISGNIAATLSGSVVDLKVQANSDFKTAVSDDRIILNTVLDIQPLKDDLPIKVVSNLVDPIRVVGGDNYLDVTSAKINIFGPIITPTLKIESVISSNFNTENTTLTADADVSTSKIIVKKLVLALPEGELSTAGELDFVDTLRWNGEIQLNDVGLEQWQSQEKPITGIISASTKTKVVFSDNNLSADVDLESLSGLLNELPITGKGLFSAVNDSITIKSAELTYADKNTVNATGTINSSNSNLALKFSFENFAPFVENLTGSASGLINVRGELIDPSISATATTDNVRLNNLSVAHSDISVVWRDKLNASNQIKIRAKELRSNGSAPTEVAIEVNGSLKEHSLTLNWIEPIERKQNARLGCEGEFPNATTALPYSRWVGVCDEFSINYEWQNKSESWKLTHAIELDVATDPLEFSISTFCIQNGSSKICNEEFVNYTDSDIASLSLSGEKLPLLWAAPFLPPSMRVIGDWEFSVTGDNLITNNKISAQVIAKNTEVQWLEKEKIQSKIEIETTSAHWNWDRNGKNDSNRVTWEINTRENGNVLGHMNIAQQTLDGELLVQSLQLKNISNIVVPNPEDSITGEINGQLTLTGTLQAPIFNGQLKLTDGYVESTVAPVPVKSINLALNIKENNALLDGSFIVNKSPGEINGAIRWQVDTWSGDLNLKAKELVFQPEPKMQFYLSPDLRLVMSPELMELTGVVNVPKARVEIEELPEQTISESSDTVIVGEEKNSQQQEINSVIKLVLGDDVRFKGFGLETNIKGSLDIKQKNNELLKANGVLELKKGSYKAYGQNLLIQEGDLVFLGNIENPQLRVSAIRGAATSDDVTVGLLATGAISNPRISLFSKPAMSQQAQLSYLLTGNAPGVQVSTDPALAASEAALSYALASDVGLGFTKKAGEAFGIEDFQVTAGSSSANSESGTQIGLSGYVTPRLMVRYGVGVFDAFNSLTLNYRLSKNLYLEVISGESSALDLLWSFERE